MGEAGQTVGLSDAAGGSAARGVSARLSLKRFVRDEGGATAIEYGLMAALLAVTIIACMSALTPGVGDLLAGVADKFPTIG